MSTPARRRASATLALAAAVAVLPAPAAVTAAVPSATTAPSVTRLTGSDRYEVSARASATTFAPGVPVAYVATGENFPDALSGGPVAGDTGGPMLLVRPTSVPAPIATELARLKPRRIVVLGGPAAVSESVRSGLTTYTSGTVTRLTGADRYEVSARASATTFAPGVPVAYVATGENFPDALSGGPAGGTTGGPMLLVRPTSVPAPIATELARLKPQRIVVLGGPAAVSESVRSGLTTYTSGTVTRLTGADRYEVSARASATTFAPGVPVAYVATGENFPDALSGGPAGGTTGGPMLLVRPTSVPAPIATELARLKPQRIVVLGGPAAVSGSVADQLTSPATPTTPIPPPPSVGGKPGPDNTGVPAGTTLTASSGMTVTKDNTVIDAKDISGPVFVAANNVTIKRSKIHGTGTFGVTVRSGSVSIEDSELYGFENGIGYDNWTATRVEIHSMLSDGVKFGNNVTLQDSWIHAMTPAAGAHADGGQMQDGVRNVMVRHNTIDMANGSSLGNSAVFLAPDLGPSTNGPVTITDNWLNGGNYTLYCVDGNNGQYFVKNISITNNRFGRAFRYGPSDTNVPFTQSGNVWADTGASLKL